MHSTKRLQANPLAKKLAVARRVLVSYERFAPSAQFLLFPNVAGTVRVLVSLQKYSALRAEY
jgi:hypothetical protein